MVQFPIDQIGFYLVFVKWQIPNYTLSEQLTIQ